MASLITLLFYVLDIVKFIIFAHVIMSLLLSFGILNYHQPVVNQIWRALERLLEPLYGPIRRVMPDLGGLDLSPLVVLFGIYAIEVVIANNVGYLM